MNLDQPLLAAAQEVPLPSLQQPTERKILNLEPKLLNRIQDSNKKVKKHNRNCNNVYEATNNHKMQIEENENYILLT